MKLRLISDSMLMALADVERAKKGMVRNTTLMAMSELEDDGAKNIVSGELMLVCAIAVMFVIVGLV